MDFVSHEELRSIVPMTTTLADEPLSAWRTSTKYGGDGDRMEIVSHEELRGIVPMTTTLADEPLSAWRTSTKYDGAEEHYTCSR